MSGLMKRIAALEAVKQSRAAGPMIWGVMQPGESAEGAAARVRAEDPTRPVMLWQASSGRREL